MISLPTWPRRSSANSQKYRRPIIGVLATKRTKATNSTKFSQGALRAPVSSSPVAQKEKSPTIAAQGYDALDIVVSNVVLFELVKSFRALRKFFPRPRES